MSTTPQWRSGERVLARGERWTIADTSPFDGGVALRLCGAGPSNLNRIRTLLTPFDRPRLLSAQPRWRTVRPRRWLHAIRRAALDAHPFGALRAAAGARIELMAYQLEPALSVWRHGATRVLIADDVGLGKTVQAGLVLAECAARCGGMRAIVLTPAGLRDQWARELRDLFGLCATQADAGWLRRASRELPGDVNPWSLPGIFIASFDFAKRPEVLRPLEEVTWDLAIADEVHGASSTTYRHAAVHAAAARARTVLLLTATPHAGDRAQFESICSIGAPDPDDRIVMFRRMRADVTNATPRRTAMLAVRPSGAERRMHRLLERYTAAVCREARTRGDPRGRLAAIVLRKRALSSAGSLAASVRRRMDLLAGADTDAEQMTLPMFDEDPLPDAAPDAALAAPGLADAARERRWLSVVAEAAQTAAASETKAAFLLRLLRRVREPAIVFTEYRDTLARLHGALEARGIHALLLHGGMTPAERGEVQRQFNEAASVLLATDAASEGLNLHARCRFVIHYELPWSPARLQQRTGRVDRIGQRRRVHEALLVADDTCERIVLAPLFRRALRAGGPLGGGSLSDLITENRVATAVLGTAELNSMADAAVEDVTSCTTTPDLRAEAETESARLALLRRWSESAGHSRRSFRHDRALVASMVRPHRRGLPIDTGTLLYRLSIVANDGTPVHAAIVPIEFDVALGRHSPTTATEVRIAAAQIANQYDPIARQLLTARFDRVVRERIRAHARCVSAWRRRERAIAAAIPDAARQIVQPGLFDRRALREAASRKRVSAALQEAVVQRIAALDARERVTVTFELVGLLLRSHRRLE